MYLEPSTKDDIFCKTVFFYIFQTHKTMLFVQKLYVSRNPLQQIFLFVKKSTALFAYSSNLL